MTVIEIVITSSVSFVSPLQNPEIIREMLGRYIRTLRADDSSTLQVSKTLHIVAKCYKLSKHLEEVEGRLGANHPKTLEASRKIMTMFASADKATDDTLRLPSVLEGDVEDPRWNDEKSRGWDDELHGRLVSTIAKYKEKVRNGKQRDWVEEFKVSW